MITAGYDPLRDEGRAYAFRLQQEGTLADLVEFGGMLHGFLSSPMLLHGARRGTSLAPRLCARRWCSARVSLNRWKHCQVIANE